MPETRERLDSQAREYPDSQTREHSDSEAWERPDLRDELIRRLRDPETRQRIADALITEASGGPPDPKSGQPKGGASVIRAFELIREIALERPERSAVAAWNLAAYTDAELTVMLARLESNSAKESRDGAETSGAATARDGPEKSRSPPEVRDGGERFGSYD